MKKVNSVFYKIFIISFLSLFTFIACGYKPASHYAKKEIDGSIFINLYIDLIEPKTSILLKDKVNQILIQKLDAKLVDKKELADIIMDLKISSIKMQELQYDEDGYNKLYKAIVNIDIDYNKLETKQTRKLKVSGEHNFSIDDGTTITDTKRYEAIKNAVENALEDVLPKLAVNSYKK